MTRAARELAALLGEVAPLWRPAPFHDDPAWVAADPDLAAGLLALDDARVAALEDDPGALTRHIASLLPAAADAAALADACLDDAPATPVTLPETAGRDVPGRKWQQALHFAALCAPGAASGYVDWCCGKAHLGRLLARLHGLPVTGIEHDGALCATGRRLAARASLPVSFRQADALAADAASALTTDRCAVALHACGDLHVSLLRAGTAAGVAGLVVAPCCYHLTAQAQWRPLSRTLADVAPDLTRDDLRLAVQETVTASARVARQSATLAAWRLGFDALQRELRGVDAYLPSPSRPARVLAAGFPAFCADLATHHALVLPAGIDFAAWAARGQARLARVRRLELLRHAFRRPLEVMLAADRALFLREAGYGTQLVAFCPRTLTPRNLALVARRG